MSEYRGAEPIKLGILVDVIPPGGLPPGPRNDFLQVFEFVIDEGLEQGLVDRQVEVLYREAAGLPRGTVKAVIDVYAELVDAGCLAVFGPMVTENAIPLRKEIERRFRVPALSLCGADEWLGKWTFALPNGSMTDEPIIWADLMAKAGQTSVGVLYETSLIGQSYLKHFRRACHQAAIRVVAEEPIAQTGQEITDAVRKLHNAQPAAVVHCGFGYGVASINEALETLDWNPPRYTGTAFESAYFSPELWEAYLGWIGLEQFDEDNLVGRSFLDRFEARYGRRPEHYGSVVKRDAAMSLLHAFADATPLSPRGVKDALERVKMLPAASGSPGTRISFGQWTHRGWMGAGYLTARALLPEGKAEGKPWKTRLVGRYGQD
jgi:branched-chain amino acid transport system substrate-binding protein